ncbi:MAG TPA: exopolysaccharide biosynthesis polyprenyl glycosylphosphotransferase [Moheibacter sp.]|nr:exopolysaccharide biosynthesis polyprenyl glycosylphosphotransferase [Moheibacter sp.]
MMLKKNYSPYTQSLLICIDFLFLISLFFIFLFINDPQWERSLHGLTTFAKVHYKSLTLMIIFWLLASNQVKLYKNFRFSRFLDTLKRLIFQIILFTVVLFAISGGKKENLYTTQESIILIIILFFYLLISRYTIYQFLKFYRKKGYNSKNVIFIGYNDNSEGLENMLRKRKELGLKLQDIFVISNPTKNQTLFDDNEFINYLMQNKIDYAYVSLGNGLDDSMIAKTVEILEDMYISIGFIPSSSIEVKQNLEINYLDSFPILTYKKYPLDHTFNQIIKRTFDIIFSLTVFVFLLSWLLPIIALAVYFSQGGPILFAQKRNGLNGKEFNCLKFRTMRPDKDNNKKPTERDDPRVTKLGKILRKTSLDELPQFFNVLKGEMSIVGPRPHMVSENEAYSEIINRYALRHYVKPGITGLAQVRGHRGAVDSHKDMEMRIRTDIYYVRNWSFLLDLLIIYQTAKLMVFGDENAI